jgi:hypothetical protein
MLTIDDQIADKSGSDPANMFSHPGTASLPVAGAKTVVLGASNDFAGGIDLNSDTLDLAAAKAAGTGTIRFEPSPSPSSSPMLLFG